MVAVGEQIFPACCQSPQFSHMGGATEGGGTAFGAACAVVSMPSGFAPRSPACCPGQASHATSVIPAARFHRVRSSGSVGWWDAECLTCPISLVALHGAPGEGGRPCRERSASDSLHRGRVGRRAWLGAGRCRGLKRCVRPDCGGMIRRFWCGRLVWRAPCNAVQNACHDSKFCQASDRSYGVVYRRERGF